jgi:hypothetical protein
MKVCSKCGIDKELTDFNKDCTASDGYSYLCKPCRKEYRKVCRANNPAMYERRKAKSREWWDKKRDGDPLFFAKHCFRNRQVVAKKLGIPFGIKFEDLPPVPEKCPVLGIAIAHAVTRPHHPFVWVCARECSVDQWTCQPHQERCITGGT